MTSRPIIPNGKTDINANGELSTDYVGYNYTYPTNTYAGRQAIWQAHAGLYPRPALLLCHQHQRAG